MSRSPRAICSGPSTFYTSVLGFRLKSRHPVNADPLQEVVYLTLGDTMIELLGMARPVPAPANPQAVGYRMMALEVADMDQAVEYLKAQERGNRLGPGHPRCLQAGRDPRPPTAWGSNCVSGKAKRSNSWQSSKA